MIFMCGYYMVKMVHGMVYVGIGIDFDSNQHSTYICWMLVSVQTWVKYWFWFWFRLRRVQSLIVGFETQPTSFAQPCFTPLALLPPLLLTFKLYHFITNWIFYELTVTIRNRQWEIFFQKYFLLILKELEVPSRRCPGFRIFNRPIFLLNRNHTEKNSDIFNWDYFSSFCCPFTNFGAYFNKKKC